VWTEHLEECRSGVAWENPGDLGDRPADKISVPLDQGPEIRRICRLDHRTIILLATSGLFPDATLLYAHSGHLSDL